MRGQYDRSHRVLDQGVARSALSAAKGKLTKWNDRGPLTHDVATCHPERSEGLADKVERSRTLTDVPATCHPERSEGSTANVDSLRSSSRGSVLARDERARDERAPGECWRMCHPPKKGQHREADVDSSHRIRMTRCEAPCEVQDQCEAIRVKPRVLDRGAARRPTDGRLTNQTSPSQLCCRRRSAHHALQKNTPQRRIVQRWGVNNRNTSL